MYVCMYVCVCIYISICVCVCVRACVRACMQVCKSRINTMDAQRGETQTSTKPASVHYENRRNLYCSACNPNSGDARAGYQRNIPGKCVQGGCYY